MLPHLLPHHIECNVPKAALLIYLADPALLTRNMVAPAHHIVQRGKSAANYAIKWRL